uniref:Uncharacterized protein AlNc14C170G7976 n=1 Tax=Albugo laibachii Nc14 TaxID=890382 RepID=F0WNE9_9STRA|nr:conserved hypothetical protein [Albugo laibachii Nc14]|eukprot:CCA22840.1 conserved hypothetical protein [Albugo laibachii Nc14]
MVHRISSMPLHQMPAIAGTVASVMLGLKVTEVLQVGPISSRYALCLLPLSKKKKKQKFVVGDELGNVSGFQIRNGDPQLLFKPLTLDSPITCIEIGSSKENEDKVFISTNKFICGINKKGKEVYRFQSNLSERIVKIFAIDNKLRVATDSIVSEYEAGSDSGTYMCPDRINDMTMLLSPDAPDYSFSALACQDCSVRIISKSTLCCQEYVGAPVTSICSPKLSSDTIRTSGMTWIMYATTLSQIGLLEFDGKEVHSSWITSLGGRNNGVINSITCSDINGGGNRELIIGRDDGYMEIFLCDIDGNTEQIYEHLVKDSIQTVKSGSVSSRDSNEIIACTFSGKVLLFTPGTESESGNLENRGRTSETQQREVRLSKLRKEVRMLQDKIIKEKEKNGRWKEKECEIVVENIVMTTNFQLKPERGYYDLSIQLPVKIEMVVLFSVVPVEIFEHESTTAIASRNDSTKVSTSHYLSTFRCLDATSRFSLKIKTFEGQAGEIEVNVVTDTALHSAVTTRHVIKPLSLHQRVIQAHDIDMHRAINTMKMSGNFTLIQVHEWISQCLPDVPVRFQDEKMSLLYKHVLLGSILICRYKKDEAFFASPSASTIAILKGFLAQEAALRKIDVNVLVDVKKESTNIMLDYFRPLFEENYASASRSELFEGLTEIQLHEPDNTTWLASEYQSILKAGKNGTSYVGMEYLEGILVDLYVDTCKCRGKSAPQNLSTLRNLIERRDFDCLSMHFLQI